MFTERERFVLTQHDVLDTPAQVIIITCAGVWQRAMQLGLRVVALTAAERIAHGAPASPTSSMSGVQPERVKIARQAVESLAAADSNPYSHMKHELARLQDVRHKLLKMASGTMQTKGRAVVEALLVQNAHQRCSHTRARARIATPPMLTD